MSDSPKNPYSDLAPQWEKGRNEHESLQLQRMAKLPFSKKLAWLEEAHRLVMRLQAARSTRADGPDDSVKT
jgi:type II secretory pathway component PulM